ncbi:carbohydrate porin [Aliiruegeria sabulilitoris]|uniref:carbohydrate porin n=1 Tax=Aliiruegeria sabulilitoris TaxID=1510458 RepID=UPI000AD35C39|nr:carbohydrate porin [Aliiruegeria sabulilitoris]
MLNKARLDGVFVQVHRSSIAISAAAVLLVVPVSLHAQSAGDVLSGPDSTPSLLASDDQEKDDVLDVDLQNAWSERKASIKDRTGLDFGFDYNALGFVASESLGEDTAGSGAFRLFGSWELAGRGSENNGSLVFKFENRHRYGNVAVTDFGPELGYAGLVSSVFSDQGWRTTHLYWEQNFAEGRGVAYVGWLDVTDYVDVYALASPWQGFSNLAFQTGSGTIGGLPDGALGAAAGYFLNDNIYVAAGVADANADAADPHAGWDTLFNQGETFKSFEIGWTTGQKARFVNNAHLTFWQIDEREEAGTPEGHGVAFSVSQIVGEHWFPFLRGGWSDGGGSLYETALSTGFGYSQDPSRSILGAGINWSRPNEETFGAVLDDQITVEVFQKWQLTEGFELTPSIQIIQNPAFNPDEDMIALFGLRFRAAF